MASGTTPAQAPPRTGGARARSRVVVASSLATIFEWYDFYLYATLAPFFAVLFFPPGNEMAALLSAFATYAAGFLIRPFGALFFGRVGDLAGRKYTFLVTILVMGFATFAIGLLPTFASVGWLAPILLVALRLLQGLALGGEYGGAATYVAEHAAPGRRGFDTAWVQTTASLGFLLSLVMIGLCRFGGLMTPEEFANWGWRIPFLLSLLLLIFSIYIRLRLDESPVFLKMKVEGKGSEAPIRDSFLRYPNNKYVLLALFGATAGQGVVWYTGQFYALYFLTITLRVDERTAYTLVGLAVLLGTPLFVFFGWLSDRIGRRGIILAGCVIAAATYFHLFAALTHYANPALEKFQRENPVSVLARDCSFHIFVGPWSEFTDCDRARDFLGNAGLSFTSGELPAGSPHAVVVRIGDTELRGWDQAKYTATLEAKGFPARADGSAINRGMTLLILFVMVLYAAMVYGPIAAFLVEMFPTRIRYTSLSLPYHIGNGWFGGVLPLLATALVAVNGNIYFGLWYAVGVALMTAVVGFLFLRDRKDIDLQADEFSRR
ncbi:MAG: MFS transporter [Burkholderiales bacterium]